MKAVVLDVWESAWPFFTSLSSPSTTHHSLCCWCTRTYPWSPSVGSPSSPSASWSSWCSASAVSHTAPAADASGAAGREPPPWPGSHPWSPPPAAPGTASTTASCATAKWWPRPRTNTKTIPPPCYPPKPRNSIADNNLTCCKTMLWPRAIISLKHSLHHNSLYKQLYSSRHCLPTLGEAPHNPLAIVHPHPHLPVLNSLLKGKIPGMAQIQFLKDN